MRFSADTLDLSRFPAPLAIRGIDFDAIMDARKLRLIEIFARFGIEYDLETLESDPAIIHANGVLTSYLGPDELIAALSAEFRDDLHTADIEQAILRIEDAMRVKHPELRIIYVKPQTPEVWEDRIRDRMGDPTAMDDPAPDG